MLFTAFHRGANVGSRAGTGGPAARKTLRGTAPARCGLSKVGHGTTVTVRLPVLEPTYEKILVIEDEPEMRRNITALLRYKMRAHQGENGRQG